MSDERFEKVAQAPDLQILQHGAGRVVSAFPFHPVGKKLGGVGRRAVHLPEGTVTAMESRGTRTTAFGAGRREGHDASPFYERFAPPVLSDDDTIGWTPVLVDDLRPGRAVCGSSSAMTQLPDNSVALVVTSPPYFVGKEYELAVASGASVDSVPETYLEYLQMLRDVFSECLRVLEPGGRMAINVANLGRKPYRSLSADVIGILQDDLGMLLRGEIIWRKARASGGSCAWGSFAKASNPVLRDVTERIIVAGKGSFSRAVPPAKRAARGLPHRSTLTNDEFIDATLDVWEIDAESARRVGHPAPFPVELPQRLIELYTYVDDIVVDPFLGSGTTLVAAARTGRVGVGYDTDPHYVALAQSRLNAVRPPSADARAGLALDERRTARDIAGNALRQAGFEVSRKAKLAKVGLAFDLVATAAGRRFYVDVVGAFTTPKPGMLSTDEVWRVLGKLSVLSAVDPDANLMVLTPRLPRRGSEAEKALLAVGSGRLFDVVELFAPDTPARLAHYADGTTPPLPGFWLPRLF